jgi:hypothetical protein
VAMRLLAASERRGSLSSNTTLDQTQSQTATANVYGPTTVGPTEKDAAADSLCARASVPTFSLSLPSLLSLSP